MKTRQRINLSILIFVAAGALLTGSGCGVAPGPGSSVSLSIPPEVQSRRRITVTWSAKGCLDGGLSQNCAQKVIEPNEPTPAVHHFKVTDKDQEVHVGCDDNSRWVSHETGSGWRHVITVEKNAFFIYHYRPNEGNAYKVFSLDECIRL